jgi:hypothetical protein
MPRLEHPFGNGGRDRQVQRRSGGAVAAVAEARDESQETPTDPDSLLLESKMAQPEIARTTRVSLSTVNPSAYGLRPWRVGGARSEGERRKHLSGQ